MDDHEKEEDHNEINNDQPFPRRGVRGFPSRAFRKANLRSTCQYFIPNSERVVKERGPEWVGEARALGEEQSWKIKWRRNSTAHRNEPRDTS